MSGAIFFDMTHLDLIGRGAPMRVAVRDLVLGGWSGRNQDHVQAHIRELAALGISAPVETPVFYRVAASLVTTASWIDVAGTDSTGEVEFVLFDHGGEMWVGVGSDQTDRKVEAIGITISKQLCAKPVSTEVWAFSEIESHWDELRLRSFTMQDGRMELYQDASVAQIRHPRNLLELYGRFGAGTVLFSGTPPVLRGFEWSDRFRMELIDPVLGRTLRHEYQIRALPLG